MMSFKRNTILLKTVGVVCVVITTLIVVQVITSHTLVLRQFTKLEEQEMGIKVQQAVSELKGSLQKIETIVKDWAPWDDTYGFVQGENPAFIEKNLSDEAFINLNINFIVLINADQHLTYTQFFDQAAGAKVDMDAEVLHAITLASPLMLHNADDVHAHLAGILLAYPDKPLLVAAAPIVTSQFEGPIRGTLILGRYLDRAEVAKMSADIKLALTLGPHRDLPAQHPVLTIEADGLTANEVAIEVIDDRNVAGSVQVLDLFGNPALTLSVSQSRVIFRQGMAMWQQHTISMAVLGVIFIVLLLGLLNRFILRKLTTVTQQVDRIAGQGGYHRRLEVRGGDEISNLAERINSMLDALEQYQSMQRENEHFLKGLLDSINCGVMVINAADGLIVDINKTGAALLQQEPEAMVGRSGNPFLNSGGMQPFHAPDTRQAVELSEQRMIRADGSQLPVLQSVATVERGDQRALIVSFIEISGLKEVQRKLQLSEAKYRLFYEEDLTSNFISTPDGRILDCNPAFARMLGYPTVAAALRVNIADHYFSPADRQAVLDKLNTERRLERHEWKLRHLRGHAIYCIGNAIAVFDEQGRPQEYRVYIFDDTRRVTLERDMRQRQKLEAIGTLAGGIAHDFNNILAGIIGYTEIIKRDLADLASPKIEKYLQNILLAGERARDLIRQILLFSRQSDMELRPVVLRQAIEDVIQLVRASLPATIAIEQYLGSEATVLADQVQLHQVIMNLCTNAGHAMKNSGGTLTLRVTDVTLDHRFTDRYDNLEPGEYACIQVSDTGKGIPEHLLDRIFDPFFTTKKKGEGTGLGLSMVHGIVSSMKGLILVDSTEGYGTQFDIYLPKVTNAEEGLQLHQETLPGGTEHIVYVDDDPFLVDIGKEILQGLGYRVTTFTQSPEALQYLGEHGSEVDLVISDLTMPKLTGIDLARALQKQQAQIPVLLCTGHNEGLTGEDLQSVGIETIILKPITMHNLALQVRTALDRDKPSPA